MRATKRTVFFGVAAGLLVVLFFPPVLWHDRGTPSRIAGWEYRKLAPALLQRCEAQLQATDLDPSERKRLLQIAQKYREMPPPGPRPGLLELVPDTRFATWFSRPLYYLDAGYMVFWAMLVAEVFAVLLIGAGLFAWASARERRRTPLLE